MTQTKESPEYPGRFKMRLDTQKLVVENELLKRRIAHLECQIVTHGWAGWQLH